MGDLSQGLVANLVECVGAVKPKSGPTSSLDQSEYVEASTHFGGFVVYQELRGLFRVADNCSELMFVFTAPSQTTRYLLLLKSTVRRAGS